MKMIVKVVINKRMMMMMIIIFLSHSPYFPPSLYLSYILSTSPSPSLLSICLHCASVFLPISLFLTPLPFPPLPTFPSPYRTKSNDSLPPSPPRPCTLGGERRGEKREEWGERGDKEGGEGWGKEVRVWRRRHVSWQRMQGYRGIDRDRDGERDL